MLSIPAKTKTISRENFNYRLIRILACSAILLLALTALQHAKAGQKSAVNGITLTNFIAHVDINLSDEAKDISYAIEPGTNANYRIQAKLSNSTLFLEGPRKPNNRQFRKQIRGYGPIAPRVEDWLKAYPTITITAPSGSDIAFKNFIATTKITGDAGYVSMGSPLYLAGSMESAQSADIHVAGAGAFAGGDVAGALDASIGGSGSLHFNSAGTAKLNIGGSGKLSLDAAKGHARAAIGGSGDIRIGNVEGNLKLSVAGSGKINAGEAQGLNANIAGSGKIMVAQSNGPINAAISGSGKIIVEGGEASALEVKISGSGDVRLGLIANNPEISISGSGDVFLDDYQGDLRLYGKKGSLHLKADR